MNEKNLQNQQINVEQNRQQKQLYYQNASNIGNSNSYNNVGSYGKLMQADNLKLADPSQNVKTSTQQTSMIQYPANHQKSDQNQIQNSNQGQNSNQSHIWQTSQLQQQYPQKPQSQAKVKRYLNLNQNSRNLNAQLLGNHTQNAIIYSNKNDQSPYREILLNKTQELNRDKSQGLNRSPIVSINQSGQLKHHNLMINKSVINEGNFGEDAQSHKLNQIEIQPIILKQALLQRQQTHGTSTNSRLQKSPLLNEIKNDKKLQKIHNIYLNGSQTAQITIPGNTKNGVDYPSFQSQQIQSNTFIQHKRKIKPSTAGNPSSKSYFMQANQQLQQQFQYNFLPYDNVIKSRSKSPQKFLGQPKYSQQYLGNGLSNQTQSINEYSVSLSKHIDNLFTKKKYSLQPQNSNQLPPPSRDSSADQKPFDNLQSTQQKINVKIPFSNQSENKKDIFLIRKNSLKNKFIDNKSMILNQTHAYPLSHFQNEQISKFDQSSMSAGKVNRKQNQKFNNIEAIKLGNREDARDKLIKLLQRQKGQIETIQSTNQLRQKQIFDEVSNNDKNKQDFLALGGKLSKTQNYNISKIMNEGDDQEIINEIIDHNDSHMPILSTNHSIGQQQVIAQNFDIQNLSTPRMMILPSDDFSEVENPESMLKIQEDGQTTNTNDSAQSQHNVSEFIIDQNHMLQQQIYYVDDTMTRKKQQTTNLIVEEMQPLYYFNIKPTNIETEFGEEENQDNFNNQNTGLNMLHNKNQAFMKEASTPFFLGSPVNQTESQQTNKNTKNKNIRSIISIQNQQNQFANNSYKDSQNPIIMNFDNTDCGSFGGSQRSNQDDQ
eukprot:403333177